MITSKVSKNIFVNKLKKAMQQFDAKHSLKFQNMLFNWKFINN